MSKKNVYNILSKINNPYHDPYEGIKKYEFIDETKGYKATEIIKDDKYHLFKKAYEEKYAKTNLVSKLKKYIDKEDKIYAIVAFNSIDIIYILASIRSVNKYCYEYNLKRYIQSECPDNFIFELYKNSLDKNNTTKHVSSITLNAYDFVGDTKDSHNILKDIKLSGINLKIKYKDILTSKTIIHTEISKIELDLINNELNYPDDLRLEFKPNENNKMNVILTGKVVTDAEYFKQRYESRWILKLDTSYMIYD
jgi:hypothetical protein